MSDDERNDADGNERGRAGEGRQSRPEGERGRGNGERSHGDAERRTSDADAERGRDADAERGRDAYGRGDGDGRSLRERLDAVRITMPTRGNRRLEKLIDRAAADPQVLAWWHLQQVGSERLGMSDHSWVHIQIVANIALRMLRLAERAGIPAAMVADHGMGARDSEVVVTAGAFLHDAGMSIHRADHEAYSLFLAEPKLRELLAGVYAEPELTVVVSEALHCIIGHRRRGRPYTLEAGVVRVADALDMAQGRARIPVERGEVGIHSISAAAIDDVRIERGSDRPIRVEIRMNNSAGIFQVDDLLATKIRGTPLEGHIEVVAQVEGETEKRLMREFRI